MVKHIMLNAMKDKQFTLLIAVTAIVWLVIIGFIII